MWSTYTRVQVFIWLMLQTKIMTVDNLVIRGWELVNRCVLCKRQAESVRHILQECSYSKTVISLNIQRTNRYLAQNGFFTRGEYQRAILESNQKGVKQMQVVFCFVLGRERCARIFRDEQKPPQILANEMRRV